MLMCADQTTCQAFVDGSPTVLQTQPRAVRGFDAFTCAL